jgi:anti-sigma B factor antagonist
VKPSCEIEIVQRDDRVVILVQGEVDLATSPWLAQQLEAASGIGAREVIVDLDRVSFMDSTGLHVLLSHVNANRDGSQLRVTRGSEQVRRLFELVGALEHLPFVDGQPSESSE